jgi:hypothetical protein
VKFERGATICFIGGGGRSSYSWLFFFLVANCFVVGVIGKNIHQPLLVVVIMGEI